MTLLILEGFDGAGTTLGSGSGADMRNYIGARYNYNSTTTTTGSIRAETGWGFGQALSWGDDGGSDTHWIDLELGSSLATVYIGFAIRPGNRFARTQEILFQTWDGTTRDVVDCRVNNTATLSFFRDSFVRLAPAAYNVLRVNQWNYLEVKITHSATVGVIEVRVNGQEVLNETGLNTSASGSVTCSKIRLIGAEGQGLNDEDGQYLIDDLYVDDASFQGPIKIESLLPTAEGATINFTPSTGTDNSANVDENPRNDDTDYNSSADTASNKDLFTTANLSNITGGIIGVQVTNDCRIDAAGDIGMQSIVAEGTPTQGTGSVVEVTDQANWAAVQHIFETNPDTASAWVVSEVNGMEIGYEVD